MQVLVQNGVATMSSMDMVDYINGERKAGAPMLAHSDFMKKVPSVLGEGHGNYSDTYKHPQNGQTYPCYRFQKREACLMAMSYSYELQAKVFDRMTALEAQQNKAQEFQLPDFTDPAAAAIAWAEQYKEKTALAIANKAQAEQLDIAAPKVAVYELLADRKQDVCTTIVAKQLGTSAPKLNDFLREHGVKMMVPDLPKAGYINWFNVVSVIANGKEHLQCLITPYGQIEITKLWHTHKIKNILQKVPKLL